MSFHLQRQIDQVKKMILDLGARVEESVSRSLQAVRSRDPELAQRVIDEDEQIDLAEIEIEEECLHALALDQPVAFDLRYLVAVLKINNDLERIADLAVNIAEQADFLAEQARLPRLPPDLDTMGQKARAMLEKSLDALVHADPDLAEQVRVEDDRVDRIHRQMYERIQQAIRDDPTQLEQQIHLLNVSRNLERIADHAVNVAEDVIYALQGNILRHSRPHPLHQDDRPA